VSGASILRLRSDRIGGDPPVAGGQGAGQTNNGPRARALI